MKRNRVVSVRLTEEEYELLRRKALPRSRSQYLRAQLTSGAANPVMIRYPIPATAAAAPTTFVLWNDATVGSSWPGVTTG